MPMELRTGLPGAGKTLGAVEKLMEFRKLAPERPLYQLGIDGLRDGLAIEIDEKALKSWKDFPSGAIIFVDECQKYMPAKRGTSDSPQWIRDLSEYRHLGLDFVFITQHPSLIDTTVRKLVDCHIHTVRKYGTHNVERWRWPICQADPNSVSAKKQAEQKSVHRYSKAAMASYKSAELHTVKRRIPRFMIIGAIVFVLLPVLAWLGVHILRMMGRQRADTLPVVHSMSGVPASSSSSFGYSGSSKTLTREQWIERQMPRVAGLPWSAPIYDDRKVQADPEVYCAKIETGLSTFRCSCITEQGTHADVPAAMCLLAVENGVYNPFRKPAQDRPSQVQPVPSPKPAVPSPLPSASFTGASSARGAAVPPPGEYVPPTFGPWNPQAL